ncbi:Kinesin motor domain [Dillenia turbinata]|uniref:Kinesin motor domain n=1 Tax=Dillenia turbinata TaxID=194707 RepID=A0AAN8VN16_9MAGN
MENSEVKSGSGDCVRVAVNIRPLITSELLVGCTDCVNVVPGEPQVQIGSHAFTFDYVYGSGGSTSSRIFEDCVAPLVDAIFHGYNATVLAYGQTGSGKTYTMGTNYNWEEHNGGIIPKVMETIFARVEKQKDSIEFLIRVSFIEIFKEEVFDLLDMNPQAFPKAEGSSLAKASAPARNPIQIRETVSGGIILAGVTEAEVRTKEEMASYLSRGSLARATGSTNMNSQSSRSHAIFTISMEQKKLASCSSLASDEEVGDVLSAKLHLVDLAGSERAKRTGADGTRLKEGIHINKGLLALGNVISALGDEKKRKEGGHVPYRDSKLTRLLQDSLGGNSKTVMIACVSPADTNAEETLNTLKYANRARNIQNKAIINRDPVAAQMQRMRNQIEQLQAELIYFRSNTSAPFEELQILKHKIALLEASNAELQQELHERRISCEHLVQQAIDAQVEKDKLVMMIESARNGKSWDEIDSTSDQDSNLVKSYVSKIQELEGELLHLQSMKGSKCSSFDCLDLDDSGLPTNSGYISSIHELSSFSDPKDVEITGETEDEAKELEHSSLQEKLDRDLKELDRKLEQKEAEMKRFANVDTSVLKQHYEKKLQDLEQEKKALQKEIEELRYNLASISSASDDGAQKLKEEYLQKLNVLEAQVSELKKKQDAQSQLLRQKQKSDEAAKRLQDEIHRIKTQKVQLQHKVKQESEQFRLWKASREKEVLQLKKEGRRNEYEMHKLLALNQRQKMVLQRKTEEASLATKRLKELLEARKASSRESSSAENGKGPGLKYLLLTSFCPSEKALVQAIEHELEVIVRVHEVRSEYEHQMEVRARMAKEVAKLKEEADAMSPGARNSRIFALENMLATSSSTLVSMASQLSEAEEREQVFSGRGRWNQVRSLVEAKNLMNHLFNLASSSRCALHDKEVDCREKETENRELKEKVIKLTSYVRQLEMQKGEILQQLKTQRLASKKISAEEATLTVAPLMDIGEGYIYDLRKGPRSSIIFNRDGGNINLELLEDMDTSESDHSDMDSGDDEWVETGKRPIKRRSRLGHSGSGLQGSRSADNNNAGNSDAENSAEGTNAATGKDDGGICCSCTRGSFCKTLKCQCRTNGSTCGSSCGCSASKCSNRETTLVKVDSDDISQSEGQAIEDNATEKNLVSHGAMLLQSALAEKPTEMTDDNGRKRKPLSDIGNTLAKSNAPKPNQRKQWRKSVIQLVPTIPETSQPESIDTTEKPEKNVEPNLPLRLPRAMRSATSNVNPLRERNSEQADEPAMNKETGVSIQRSPVKQPRISEKENHGIQSLSNQLTLDGHPEYPQLEEARHPKYPQLEEARLYLT